MREKLSWSEAEIPFAEIDCAQVRADENLFFVLAAASLIESGSDLYTRSLIAHFRGYREVENWLAQQWESEELRHGRVLRRYIERVWPEFDWTTTFDKFMVEYSGYCSVAMLEPDCTLELVARCVVEMGTSGLYRALHTYVDEPVLKRITANIWRDEVQHYKHFYHYFKLLNAAEPNGRFKIARVLVKRLREIRHEDSDCALRHVFAMSYPNEKFDSEHFIRISRASRNLVLQHVSSDMMVKMFLKPLALPAPSQRYIQPPLTRLMARFLTA